MEYRKIAVLLLKYIDSTFYGSCAFYSCIQKIEMKIWHGQEYNKRGEKQLAEYLDYYHINKGYMISFNFNKKKAIGVQDIFLDNRQIAEAIV